MEEYLPIRITIKKGDKYIYPDLDKIPSVTRKELTWTRLIDVYGTGMQYEKNALMPGQMESKCATIVPADFAEAATEMYPDTVEVLAEAEWEDYYDNTLHANEPLEIINRDELLLIQIRMQLEKDGILPPPSQDIINDRIKALDPNDATRQGVIKNKRRRWADYKQTIPAIKIKAEK